MSISSRAILVRFTVKGWTAQKIDKRQTQDVAGRTGADPKAGKYIKDLMVGTKYVSEINKYAGASRLYSHGYTLPWDDMGDRVIPKTLVIEYKASMNKKRDSYYNQRDYICNNYAALQQTAANFLGVMYNPSDYPPVDEVYAKYDWRVAIKCIPKKKHLFQDLADQDMEEMREELTEDLDKENAEKTAKAMSGAWHRLHGTLSTMSEKLTETDKKRHWHDSFVTNPKELCDLLGHLNVTDDPKLDSARVMLERTMSGADLDSIKESPATREDMKVKVDSIISQFDW